MNLSGQNLISWTSSPEAKGHKITCPYDVLFVARETEACDWLRGGVDADVPDAPTFRPAIPRAQTLTVGVAGHVRHRKCIRAEAKPVKIHHLSLTACCNRAELSSIISWSLTYMSSSLCSLTYPRLPVILSLQPHLPVILSLSLQPHLPSPTCNHLSTASPTCQTPAPRSFSCRGRTWRHRAAGSSSRGHSHPDWRRTTCFFCLPRSNPRTCLQTDTTVDWLGRHDWHDAAVCLMVCSCVTWVLHIKSRQMGTFFLLSNPKMKCLQRCVVSLVSTDWSLLSVKELSWFCETDTELNAPGICYFELKCYEETLAEGRSAISYGKEKNIGILKTESMSQFEEENKSTWTSYPLSKDDRNKERTNADEKVKCLWDGVIKRQKERFRKMKKEKDKRWKQRWRKTAQTRALNHSRQSRSTMYKVQCTQILSTTVGCTTPGVIDSSSHTSRGSQRLDCHPRSAYFLSVRTKTTCQRCELGGSHCCHCWEKVRRLSRRVFCEVRPG